MIMLIYFLICTVSFFVITWVMIRSIRGSNFPPNNDDDGGMPGGNDFPLIDLPPGGKIEDILVDRWYDDVKKPTNQA
ncbi:MAG: hypothetical protein HC880_11425 [Bacteroidia bacterium]|nr:hypothetical protein [Bacteroidia bacterium]